MKIEDKLAFFSQKANEEAEQERERILADINKRMSEHIAAVTDDEQKKAGVRLRVETSRIEQAKNKGINMASTESKKAILSARGKLLDELFDGAIDKIRAYTATGEYAGRLVKDIADMSARYGNVKVYIMERDIPPEGALPGNCERVGVKDDFIGGFKLLIPEKNAIEDDTYLERLKNVRENFNELKLTYAAGNGKEAGQ